MAYTILSFTRYEIASGAGLLPLRLSGRLIDRLWELIQTRRPAMETCEAEIYFLNSFPSKDSFDELKARFGGNPMEFQFLNECAVRAFEHFNIPINPIGTVEALPAGVGVLLRNKFALV
jgi:hypothetical protein